MTKTLPNDVRTCRKNSGFTQRELAHVLGYRHAGPVLRHETLRAIPPLDVAFGYEIVFRVPIARMFVGLRNEVEKDVEERLAELETVLGQRSAKERDGRATAQRLTWLSERKNTETKSELLP